MPSRLANKWVLITGASSGFGAAAARAFAAEGAKLLLGARREDRLKEVVAESTKAGANEAHAHFLDVSQTSSVDAFVQWARRHTDKLDVLERFNRDGTCASVQCDYSYLNRAAEKELLPWCRQHNVAVVVRGPLNKGVCAGKFTRDTQFTDSVREKWNNGSERERLLQKLSIVDRVRWLESPQRTLAQAALQFVAANPAVSTVIPGAKTPEQARANATAGNSAMTRDDLDRMMRETAA